MFFERIKSEGLAHYSYMFGDDSAGVCAVIDPRRDVDIYLKLAQENELRITHILETHIHADFVSGSRELAAQVNAPIYVGAAGEYGFAHESLRDGDTLEVGDFTLKALHTPGHTPEHICYLVSGGAGASEPWGLFSGDALFAGEVGRPDLLGEGTEEKLARQLYHTMFDKLLKLDEGLILYPAHGEGSPCGASIGDRETSTIGYARHHNRRLQITEEDPFVEHILDSLTPAPSYYSRMKRVNAQGPRALGDLNYLPPLAPQSFQTEMDKPGAVVVDTRSIEAFGGAHIKGALNIPMRPSSFPIWAGWLLEPEQRLLLIVRDEVDLELVHRDLRRVGIENIVGYLQQGIRGWIEAGLPFERTTQLSVHELRDRILDPVDDLQVLDVRDDDEWRSGHVATAQHRYLPYLKDYLTNLDPLKPVAVYCGSGYRASIATSILKQNDFDRVYNIPGSIDAWISAGYSLEEGAEEGAEGAV